MLDVEVVLQHAAAAEYGIHGVDIGNSGDAAGQAEGSRRINHERRLRRVVERHRIREWRIVAQRSDNIGHGLIEIETGAGANDGFTAAEGIPDYTGSGSEVIELARVRTIESTSSHGNHLEGSDIKNGQTIVDFRRHAVVFITQA